MTPQKKDNPMLERISIKNVALISELSIDLSRGLNVLSGETGAGKSLIIDSISLMLGERADRSLISHGKNFASVEAVFQVENENALSYLEEVGLEKEKTVVIFRKIYSDGRNECRVNGKSFTLAMLKKLTAFLVDLHGQFEHQSLLRVSSHVEILDDFACLSSLKDSLEKELAEIHSIQLKLEDFVESDEERERTLEFLKFAIDEISQADFKEGEEESLKEKLALLQNQEKIKIALSLCVDLLSFGETGSILENISKTIVSLGSISHFDTKFEKERERLLSAKYELSDVSEMISQLLEELETEGDFEAVDKRLDLLKLLKKKYGGSIEKINAYYTEAQKRFELLTNATKEIENLKKEKQLHADKS